MRFAFCLLLCSCATATPCEPVNPVQAEQAMRVAWGKVFGGEPLGDADLQALSDAHDVLECHAERRVAETERRR